MNITLISWVLRTLEEISLFLRHIHRYTLKSTSLLITCVVCRLLMIMAINAMCSALLSSSTASIPRPLWSFNSYTETSNMPTAVLPSLLMLEPADSCTALQLVSAFSTAPRVWPIRILWRPSCFGLYGYDWLCLCPHSMSEWIRYSHTHSLPTWCIVHIFQLVDFILYFTAVYREGKWYIHLYCVCVYSSVIFIQNYHRRYVCSSCWL